MLTQVQQRFLLRVARESIGREMAKRHRGSATGGHGGGSGPEGQVDQTGGAFVTLRIGGELRGCIGYIEYPGPVRTAVEDVARKAAFGDPRFEPLGPDELDRVQIEISVLTPMRPITSPGEITVGNDGLVISCRGHRGLLLPQVATEYGWDAEEFLENTCRKAGLQAGAWREPGAELEAFSAEVFSEEPSGGVQ
jgi:AmmeMemoRadiSam system protein A